MKFKLQSTPEGIVICRIKEPLSKIESDQVTQGIERILTSGKSKLILEFSLNAALGAPYLEKSLRTLKATAGRLGGDIKYVVPDPIGQRIFGSVTQLDVAIKSLLELKGIPQPNPVGEPVPEKKPEKEKKDPPDETLLTLEMKKLTNENRILTEKVRELLQIVRQPSTNEDLKLAVDHYRKLATEVEANQNPYIKKK